VEQTLPGSDAEESCEAALIVIHPPHFDDQLGFGQRREVVHVQTLIA
jgi:hypothetical protein